MLVVFTVHYGQVRRETEHNQGNNSTTLRLYLKSLGIHLCTLSGACWFVDSSVIYSAELVFKHTQRSHANVYNPRHKRYIQTDVHTHADSYSHLLNKYILYT